MAKFQINTTLDIPIGTLRIYVDPVQNEKAQRLIKDMPNILFEGYKLGTKRFAKRIKEAAIECIQKQRPPKGESWPELSDSTKNTKGDDQIYIFGGQYLQSIDIHQENVYYSTGAFHKVTTYVGLPRGVMKQSGKDRNRFKDITLIQVANILEHGTDKIPPRRLWEPLYTRGGAKTGREALQMSIRRAIQYLIMKNKYL